MSKDFLLLLYEKVKKKGVIDDALIGEMEKVFPNKISDVLEVVKRGVIRHTLIPSKRIVWTAHGSDREHLIYPKIFCSCLEFHKSVVIKRKHNFCKHILAQIICEALDKFQKSEENDENFKELIKEIQLKL